MKISGDWLSTRRVRRGVAWIAAAVGLSALSWDAVAGDILRGGAGAGASRRTSGGAGANAGAEAATLAQARAEDRLARTTKAVNDMRQLQTAARAAGGGAGVPDGLILNGLDPIQPGDGNFRWDGANAPVATGNDVTITQNLQQAILHWRTLNVGKSTRVTFDQSAGGIDSSKWVAFNKIYDPSGKPSQIRGQIKADGQVYIINQNGIIFGAGSQVNTRTLVASSLPINDNLVTRGLLNNPDAQFLFSADAIPARESNATMPAFIPPAPLTADGSTGDVVVERGAELKAPTTSENVGGRISLIGANVRNEGSISTPDGQTILAAGLQVGFAAHPSTDPTLRGLDVYVGNVAYPDGGTQPLAGTVTNSGIIEIPRASATLIGKSVQQLGVINSSTTTALNGRVDLLASYGSTSNTQFTSESNLNVTPLFIQRASGNVEVGAGSIIQILPEVSAGDKVPGKSLSLPSLINAQGLSVRLGKDSIILAPGASIPGGLNAVAPRDGSRLAASENLEAGVSLKAGTWISTSALSSAWAYSGGQVYFEPGATVSVAGSVNVSVPLSQSLLTVQLRGAELANSPLQRTGAVRGSSITVDTRRTGTYNGQSWVGTPLGDVSGYVGLIDRGVDQLTVAGGSVHLGAGEAVIMQRGSMVDVSGGWMRNEGGKVKTTRLLEKGRLVDIEDATPDRIYDGIYTGQTSRTSSKWGVTKTYNLSLALLREFTEPSHVQGGDAGSISIAAPSVALDGALIGQVVQGPRQSNETTLALAKTGTLNIRFQAADPVTPNFNISPTPPRVVFDTSANLPSAAAFAMAADGTPEPLGAIRKAEVVLSPTLLTESGFGTLLVENNEGTISIPIGTRLDTPFLGSVTLAAANIDIDGTVTAPGGNLAFKASNISPFLAIKLENDATRPPTPAVAPDLGVFYLGKNARLSTAGLVSDYRPGSSGVRDRPPLVDAGSISINAFDVNLSLGSSIDVSGGVSISATGARTFGAAGSLEIKAGTDPRLTWLLGGKLVLGATLSGYSGSGNGGSLSIQAPIIQIGGTLPALEVVPGATQPIYRFGTLVVDRDEILHLDPEFFSQGGFTDFTLSAIGKTISFESGQFLPAISIAENTVVKPVAKAWQTVENGDGPTTLETFVQPDGIREAVNLTFSTSVTQDIFEAVPRNLVRGDIVLGEGAVIDADPGANVTIRGGTVAIFGSIRAPGGSISIAGASSFPSEVPSVPSPQFNKALPTVHIGPRSVISTAGLVQLTPDPYGRRTGSVLPGGTIKISGNIVAEAGAVLDVSGASGVLDLRPEALAAKIPNAIGASGGPVVPVNSGVTAPLYSRRTVPTLVESDAGSITLRGGQELFSDATLRGFAGGPSAQGGSLTISSGRFYDSTDATLRPSLTDVVLVVKQSGPTIAGAFYPAGQTAIGNLVPVAVGDANEGRGHFSMDSFHQGGFDSLILSGTLGGTVGFSGDVSISARRSLSVAEGGVIFADANVSLTAPYVALGRALQTPVQVTDPNQTSALSFSQPVYPLFGPGSLTVRAKLIDLGDLSLQNIGRATFIADEGDIRGSGTLNVAGAIEMRAGQIYPTTASRFTIVAYDPNISVAASSTTSPEVTLASAVLPAGFGPGSPLLGSQVMAVDGTTVTLASNANVTIGGATPQTFAPGVGSVTITGSGTRPLPYSAGGTLGIYASTINQGGTLRAPLGTINLGWDGTGTSPVDYLTRAGVPGTTSAVSVPVTQQLTLAGGSVTSVSAVDPRTGRGLIIPFGFHLNEKSWIDPTGLDLYLGGLPAKAVNLSAVQLSDEAGSVIDVRGGGDFYSYRWDSGNGGTNDVLGTAGGDWSAATTYSSGQLVSYNGSTWSARQASRGSEPTVGSDWTLVPSSFAVLPSYEAGYSPYAPFNAQGLAANLAIGRRDYSNTGFSVGDQIYLGASSGLPAGTYTLLPARYALLEGGVLVTPRSSSAKGNNSRTSISQPEGASVVSGYRFNNLNSQQTAPAQAVRFEVAPSAVVRARAKYEDYFANAFIAETARDLGAVVPRLPQDSGRVVFSGLDGLRIDGNVLGKALPGGFDAEIDISTQSDILITGSGGAGQAGVSVLDAARLSSFGAESILIGGLRQTSETGTTISVNTSSLTVDNAGSPLTGPEFILVAKSRLTLNPGAEISQSGTTRGGFIQNALPIQIGDSATAGSGNGLLVRVSDVQLPIVRSGMSTQAAQAALATPPLLSIGAGASISGDSLVLDSSYGTQLDPTARVVGRDVALNSGQISLQFDNPGTVPQIAGLMLSGPALQVLQSSQKLSLLSYSSLDLYGNGIFQNSGTLALHAGRIRGFNTGGGPVVFSSPEIILDNSSGGTSTAAAGGNSGQLVFSSGILRLGTGSVTVDQFDSVALLTTGGLIARASGSLSVPGALTITGPVLTASRAAYSMIAAGAVNISSDGGTPDGRIVPGLGASLSFTGSSVLVNSSIQLPSGTLSLRATAGDLIVGNSVASVLDVGGTLQTFNDLVRYTDGGRIDLTADAGSLVLGSLSSLVVAAQTGGGNAGTVSISTPNGAFALNGSLDGRGGAGGESGSFLLDVNTFPDLTALNQSLNTASFSQLRAIRVRSGNVVLSNVATSRYFELSADQGSILVTGSGLIDASGATGGEIRLAAFGSVTLQSGALLTVAGQDFDSAGKGGAISLEAGSQRNGVVGTGSVDIQTGSVVDLSVASKIAINPATDAVTPGTSAYQGQFSGKLHIRAPQNAAGTDLLVNPINGAILGASSILVEGYRLFDLTNIASGLITNSGTINAAGGLMTAANNIQGSINANAQNFLGASGVTTAGYSAMLNRLLGADPQGLLPVFVLAPGAEIIHRTGNLALGTSASNENSDWNLATFRYGAKRAPGVLTVRAFGNLNFFNALSDGFTTDGALPIAERLYRAELTAQNPLLPINTQSWSYRLASGADLLAADFQRVRPLASLAANSGSLQLGKVVVSNSGNPVSNTSTSAALAGRYQVIRTGSGDIRIFAARNVQLLNQFATIYTAGIRTADPTLGGNFEVPLSVTLTDQGTLGAVQQDPTYAAQYSLAGGSVLVSAGQDILHQTQVGGVLVADSQKQIPNNWLYRRGYIDPNTGQFANAIEDGFGGRSIASTSWWVDFSNFFQGIGALGGGHVTMLAGNDISNVDAVAPTNARLTYQTAGGDRLVANQSLLELGGGDVTVKAGRNLDAGIYYVERGTGTLSAGGSIITNRTRTASIGSLGTGGANDFNPSPAQWLPTTLFLGKGSFRVSAGGDLRLGPVVNPFLMPVGLNNSFWRKSYFSTYSPTSEVSVTSLSGSITLSQSASLNTTGSAPAAASILQLWMNAVHRNATGTVAARQPWLRLAEAGASLSPFSTVMTLSPGTVRATAYSGDLNLVGRFNLSPSPVGTIELAAGGSINALQPTGIYRPTSTTRRTSWASATINLSDANPANIAGVFTPFGLQSTARDNASANQNIPTAFLLGLTNLFDESGSSSGRQALIQTQQALHGTSLLHANDSEPVRIYSSLGDISGLTLYSSKAARIVAGGDISDIAFYIQNTKSTDVSIVSSGGDIRPWNDKSLLRVAATRLPGNALNNSQATLAGDIQISGPGTLALLAGEKLDFGTGASDPNGDGLGVGLTSIGNARNPNLPFAGADLIVGAGIGPVFSLASAVPDAATFLESVLGGDNASTYLAELAASNTEFASFLSASGLSTLSADLRAKLALDLFFLVLRDAGRAYNDPSDPNYQQFDAYAPGFEAIASLFGSLSANGDITTRSRDIRTKSGGDISMLVPGGGLTLTTTTVGTSLTPPGIVTEAGGNISIFTNNDVDIGISRIFTLRGGNEVIWSSAGDIAAGASSKTVQSAPPTRVLIDPQSAALNVDLAGIATGGGIGVLATVEGVPPGSVDLIAPVGAVDAGDAGIRATGNLNIAAVQVLNADNISVGGTSAGVPTAPVVAAPNIGGLTSGSSSSAAAASAAESVANQARSGQDAPPELPSVITVEVLGYGGDDEG